MLYSTPLYYALLYSTLLYSNIGDVILMAGGPLPDVEFDGHDVTVHLHTTITWITINHS